MKVNAAISTDCQLMVTYDGSAVEGEVYVDFITGDLVPDDVATIKITTTPEVFKYTFPQDGLYVYYKLLVFKDGTTPLHYDSEEECLVLNGVKVTKHEQIEEIISNLDTGGFGIDECSERPIFSTCQLDTCAAEIERKFIQDWLRNGCKDDCRQRKEEKSERDFIIISSYVIRNLAMRGNYCLAGELRDLISSCSSLCSNLDNSASSGCGCSKGKH